MREFLDLASNPLFVKHLRSRLRRSAVMPWVIIVICLSLCIIWVNSVAKGPNDPIPSIGSQLFFWLQGFLLVLVGGSQVASSIAQMKESGMIDFHRITPIPAPVQTIGIMIGAPIRELILYAVTLPFALYLAIDGPVGLTNFAKLLLVQLGGALMYYSLAMLTGLSGGKARRASGRFVAILAGLNIFSSQLYPAGISGPTMVTSIPVYYEVFVEEEIARMRQRAAQQPGPFGRPNQQPMNLPAGPLFPKPTFFGLELPVVLQSLFFQGCFLTFLFIGASRRIHSARQPLYSKPVALLFLGTLAVLTLGSLWDSPLMPLTLAPIYFLVFCSILLTNTVTPAQGDVVKGMQRARKLSGLRVPLWSDLATNKFNVIFFACVTTVTVAVGLQFAPQPPMKIVNPREVFSPWPSLVVGILTILSYGFISQYLALAFGKRARSFFVLYLFFAWFAPIIVGVIARVAEIEEGSLLMALSPIVGIAFSGMPRITDLNESAVLIACIAPVALGALFFGALLVHEERTMLNEVAHDSGTRRPRKEDRKTQFDAKNGEEGSR